MSVCLRGCSGLLMASLLSSAAGEPLVLGHAQPLLGAVTFEIGTESADLDYRSFVEIDLPVGAHVVQVRNRSGALLAALEIDLRPDAALTPLLYLAPDLAGGSARLVFDRIDRPPQSPPGAYGPPRRFALLHEAASAGNDDALRVQVDCDRIDGSLPPGFGFASFTLAPGETWREDLGDVGVVECELRFGSPAAGGFQLQLQSTLPPRTQRVLVVGSATVAPEVLVLDGAHLADRLDPPQPQARALASSLDHWFDLVRPDQGVSLFEVGGTGIVFGSWFTVSPDNRPTWYYFEGARVQGIGRRDLVVYRGSRRSGAQALDPVGSARLQYVDCNEAEMRVLLGDDDFRTVRLRRSQPVSFCPVFD